ncbi:MAG: MBL fold metallo-hydrolase [Verrucomicrobia bacterium]|nr:MBL fold metallo-hydrolase [Verrucomicrobiota bacterium]
MTLEDHVGDVLRKARTAAGLSLEAAAAAAGIPPARLQVLEQSGDGQEAFPLPALAERLGLDGAKLGRLAQGWRPAARDLSQWRELRVCTTTRGGNAVNAYVVWDEVSREAAVFDTGWDAAPILGVIESNGLTLLHVFLTHSHDDHVAALPALQAAFPQLRLHRNTATAPPQHRNRANDFIHLGSLRVTNRPTPGHAEDGVTYVIATWPDDAPPVAMVGDTIFAGSLAAGFVSAVQLKAAVREQILTLPPPTLLCPGHGPLTSVFEEKAHNPFF